MLPSYEKTHHSGELGGFSKLPRQSTKSGQEITIKNILTALQGAGEVLGF